MKIKGCHTWMLAASLGIVVAFVATILLVPAGAAGGSGKTYTVKTVKTEGSLWIAGGGAKMTPGHLSAGNRLFETNAVRRDDGVKGVFIGTVMIVSPGTVSAQRAVGLMRAVYRFVDGDIYVDGTASFAHPSGTGVVVGGTGAFKGARGTVASIEAKDVLHLLP
jgi:hypothetical protein